MEQVTSNILMVRPASFGYNAETAVNNAFQQKTETITLADISEKAIRAFDEAVALLREKNIDVTVVQDAAVPPKPDAVFPNNWFCTLPGGKLIIFPMFAANRRIEKLNPVVQILKDEFEVKDFEDWSAYEQENIFLEGTGSMIFDHIHKIVYACLSQRTDKNLFEKFALSQGYRPVSFLSKDEKGMPVYHTNVIMHAGEDYAVVCLDSVSDTNERALIVNTLRETKHEVIPISQEQVKHFAGNMIQVKNKDGKKFTMLSSTAANALTEEQKSILSSRTDLLPLPIDLIETVGGGSARCMIAELFLERKIKKD